MERNIAALLRDDACTIQVVFNSEENSPRHDAKQYTYVTHIPVKIGDQVVVPAGSTLKVVDVVGVNEYVRLEPNDPICYSWVISKVDNEGRRANEARNEQLESLVNEAYKNNLRRGFQAQILGGLPEDCKAAALALIAPKPAA